jgi:serine protease
MVDMLRQAFWALLALAALPAAAAPEHNPVRTRAVVEAPVERLIVKLRPATGARSQAQAVAAAPAAQQLETLGARTGVLLAHSHSITTEIHVARLFRGLDAAELEPTLARLRADPTVEYAAADRRKQAHVLLPNDPLYSGTPGQTGQTGQWYMQAPQSTPAGTTTAAVNAAGAWAITTGSSGVVIADLDTGVRFDHPDLLRASLGGRLLPGYDFVGCDGGGGSNCPSGSTFATANDGNGWDPDASDPGDWVSAADLKLPVFSTGCTQDASSWHGTRTGGILAAITNNATGIAGMTWNSWLVPVRVLGKCGGYDSDIIAGMLWAAGIAVAGAPANPYPAKIINMSLGSANACVASYRDAISQLAAKGTVVVASAGNEGGPVDEPANCPGAVGVAGVRHAGSKVGYSSLGPEAALAAPAGNCVNVAAGSPCLFSIDTTTNLGTSVPGANSYTDQLNTNVGTSFSSPIVAGISALMLSVNGNLTPSQLLARLKSGARLPFPVLADASQTPPVPLPTCQVPTGFSDTSQAIECNCTTTTCGAGLADAPGSVNEALRPIAAIAVTGGVSAGQPVPLSAAASAAACGRTVAAYAWTIVGSPAGSPSLTAPTGATTSLNAAPTSGTVTVQLVVTDDQGLTDTATVAIGPSTATTTAPASAGSTACLAAVTPPAPAVTVSVSPSPITVGQSATLNWSATDATSCTAAGAWSGTEPTSGTQAVTPTAAGSLDYTLTCTGAGGSANGTAVLTVNAAAASHGGGGTLDATTLALGALLGLAARRRRAGATAPTR